MDNKDEKKIDIDDLSKEIDNLDLKEIEFNYQSNSFEMEDDESMLKFAKSRGKKKED